MKKIVSMVLMLSLILSGQLSSAEAQAKYISVFLDGNKLTFDVNPQVVNGTTLVPMRKIFEEQDAKVEWNAATTTVKATKGQIALSYKVGQLTAVKNGQVIKLTTPGRVVKGTTLVPLRFVSEALGSSVGWEPLSSTIIIDSSVKQKVKVNRVVDGDTFAITLNGREEKVRLIGVDTPETVHPTKGVQPYGKQASDYTKKQLEGKTVQLSFDVEERDKYGRLLGYVFRDSGNFYNAELVAQGYARLSTFPPNVKWVKLYQFLQQNAREAKRGLWKLTTPNPVPTPAKPVATPIVDHSFVYKTTVQNGYAVKAGLSSVRPKQNEHVTLSAMIYANGRTVNATKVYAKLKYKSKTSTYVLTSGKTSFGIGRATVNFMVKIDLVATINGKVVTFKDVQGFTPIA